MANVLPQHERTAVLRRARARFVFLGAALCAAAACIAILALLPALISTRVARAAVDAPPPAPVESDVSEDQATAARTQALIVALRSLANATTSPTKTLTAALVQKPRGISITTITYKSGGTSELALSGVSESRDEVNEYRTALDGTGLFSRVAVPVAALVGVQEGKFTITLSGKF